ncbi:MAG: aromatic amino acid hydroxylase [Pseudomonadota bacterium]
MNQEAVIASLPAHLRPFAAVQHYDRYTPRDQAVWRFLLRQLSMQLHDSAHAVYTQGLAATGLSLDTIPRIEDINEHLAALGWRAVVVSGFVPPAIFMEFQAHRVMPIAVDMRTIEHMLYTPAPDIVHESAGHLPFVVDVDYAEFLQRFGELGMHAIANRADLDVYEAVRHLSIVKESPSASDADIKAAEQRLETATAANTTPSEAALLARLHWWTVEYGLVGTTDDYRIFGAGLLSSLGESVNCLDDELVSKVPLTVDAISTAYDITTQQPQLFVTANCRHLSQVLDEFGKRMAVSVGGAFALERAQEAATVVTAVTNSGAMVSGVVS